MVSTYNIKLIQVFKLHVLSLHENTNYEQCIESLHENTKELVYT